MSSNCRQLATQNLPKRQTHKYRRHFIENFDLCGWLVGLLAVWLECCVRKVNGCNTSFAAAKSCQFAMQ